MVQALEGLPARDPSTRVLGPAAFELGVRRRQWVRHRDPLRSGQGRWGLRRVDQALRPTAVRVRAAGRGDHRRRWRATPADDDRPSNSWSRQRQ